MHQEDDSTGAGESEPSSGVSESQYGTSPCSRHPKGFPVFLSQREAQTLDEYSESDPYTVAANLGSDFHRRRVERTMEMVERAAGTLRNSPRILDVGCGMGFLTAKIREKYPDARVSGIDCALSAIEYAVEHFPRIDFAVGDANDLPYSDGYFEIVVCNNLWEHVPNPLGLLGSMRRILAPGGMLVVSTPSRYRLRNLVRVLMGKPAVFMSEHHVTEYSVGQVLEQLRYGGFETIEMSSRPIAVQGVKTRLAGAAISLVLSAVGSHHQLESTVFYLARRVETATRKTTG